MQHLIELLENLEKFEEIWRLLDNWLTKSEKSLLRDIEVAGNAQKQKDQIQSVIIYVFCIFIFFSNRLVFSNAFTQ